MAISLENLIDLDLLTYYDEQIKKYIATKTTNVKFMSVKELPDEGKEDVLYVTDEGIKTWNPETKEYEDISGESGGTSNWGSF